jgi:hypothetical protein
LIASVIIFILLNIDEILVTLNIWSLGISILAIVLLLYWLRSRFRLAYGIAEFVFGFVGAIYTVFLYNFDLHLLETVSFAKIVGGLCVMVRGLDNISKGIQGTEFEPLWHWLFND